LSRRLIQLTKEYKVNLADYDALSFDCYGTLIDWETGLSSVLAPWAREAGLDLTDEELLVAYADNEERVERENPTALYPTILAESFRRIGASLGAEVSDEWAGKLGASVPSWPAFPDSPDALASLAKEYKLIILSNVHREGFAGSNPRLGVTFDKIITAEDVGRSSTWRENVCCTWRKACTTTMCRRCVTGLPRCGSTAGTTARGGVPRRSRARSLATPWNSRPWRPSPRPPGRGGGVDRVAADNGLV
jgi:2-haloalkanoic acid dehalogenase type II